MINITWMFMKTTVQLTKSREGYYNYTFLSIVNVPTIKIKILYYMLN